MHGLLPMLEAMRRSREQRHVKPASRPTQLHRLTTDVAHQAHCSPTRCCTDAAAAARHTAVMSDSLPRRLGTCKAAAAKPWQSLHTHPLPQCSPTAGCAQRWKCTGCAARHMQQHPRTSSMLCAKPAAMPAAMLPFREMVTGLHTLHTRPASASYISHTLLDAYSAMNVAQISTHSSSTHSHISISSFVSCAHAAAVTTCACPDPQHQMHPAASRPTTPCTSYALLQVSCHAACPSPY